MRYSALLPLWPVALVWAFLVLPYLAYTARSLLDQQVIELPWYFTWPLRGLIRLPVYRKIALAGERMQLNRPRTLLGAPCYCGAGWRHDPLDWHCPFPTCQQPVATVSETAGGPNGQDQCTLGHLLREHFPQEVQALHEAEQRWAFEPPPGMTPEQADEWLDRRQGFVLDPSVP